MSFQVPGGMAITGAMLQFYRYSAGLGSHWKFDPFRATVTGDLFVGSYWHFGEIQKCFGNQAKEGLIFFIKFPF